VTRRDASPFVRRNAARHIGIAALVVAVASGFALIYGAGTPAGLTSFGIGIGLAISEVVNLFREYDTVTRMYGGEIGTIEVTIDGERIVIATEASQTTIFRTPTVRVAESHGAFLVTMRKGTPPVLLPIRHLTSDEVDALRQWVIKVP
jgi:hypothetical protein